MNDLGEQLKALGDPLRLRILKLLPDEPRCEDVYNVSELAEALSIAQPTVSHHLKILRQAGLVQCQKMCRDVYYWVDRAVVEAVARSLVAEVLPGVPGGEGEQCNTAE